MRWQDRIPPAMARRPRDSRGFPIPWFIQQSPLDFRVIRPLGTGQAHKQRICWLCGEPRYEKRLAFAVGPMCTVNRVSSEPPSHPECARFAAIACPFLSNPRMRRNDKDMPDNAADPPGIHLDRNPGVTAIWITRSYEPFRVADGTLLHMGDPVAVEWFREGRPATRAEVLASIEAGLPALEALAAKDGPDAVCELEIATVEALEYLPKESML